MICVTLASVLEDIKVIQNQLSIVGDSMGVLTDFVSRENFKTNKKEQSFTRLEMLIGSDALEVIKSLIK